MNKIKTLTPQQEKDLVKFREMYRKIGTSCEPINRNSATSAISEMYKLIGETPPKFIFCQSPFQAIIYINIFSNSNLGVNLGDNLLDNLGDNLGDNLLDNLGDNLGVNLRNNLGVNLLDNLRDNLGVNLSVNLGDNLSVNLRDNLRDNLLDNLRNNLGVNLRNNLGVNLRDNLCDNLLDNLCVNLRNNLRNNLRDNLLDNLGQKLYISTYLWGSLDSYWIAWYLFPHKYLREMHSPDDMKKLKLWDTLAKSCGWWYPYKKVCFVCDRFETLVQDEKNRLHNPDGPAMTFRDGYSIYAINGVRVPGWIIEEPQEITPEKINDESNVEIRRVMMSIYGWHKMLGDVGAEMIDKHAEPTIGELWQWNEPDGTPVKILRCLNGTPDPLTGGKKWYSLRVPLEIQTALDANRNSYPLCRHMSDDDFLLWNRART